MKRWVVKVGSQMVCSGGPVQIRAWMHQLLLLRKKYSIEVIWVTSGAIASAVERTDFKKIKSDWKLAEKQALSAIGQPLLMDVYNIALQATGLLGAQVLMTSGDLTHKVRRANFQKTIEQLLKWNVVPILNENDAIATEEIKFGDNDTLSAKVAHCTFADRLVILTDVLGLYETDPKKNAQALFVSELERVSPKILKSLEKSSGSHQGTGGMYSKIKAAHLASYQGIETVLVKGDLPHVLVELAEGNPVGTRIKALKKVRK